MLQTDAHININLSKLGYGIASVFDDQLLNVLVNYPPIAYLC